MLQNIRIKYIIQLSWYLLIIGCFLIIISASNLSSLFVRRTSLIGLKGNLASANIYVTTHSSTTRTKYNLFEYKSKSQKAKLNFYLLEYKKKFSLQKNIGKEYEDEEYENIKLQLKRADEITIWIRKGESDDYAPKVFQIDADGRTILDFGSIKWRDNSVMVFVLFAGVIFIYFSVLIYIKLVRQPK